MPEKTRLGRCSKPIRISPTHYSAFHTCRPTLSSRSCEQNSENVRVARHVSPPTGTTSPAANSSATAPSGSQATLLPDSILRLIASVRASIYRSASGGVGAPLSAQPQHPRNCLGRSPDAVFRASGLVKVPTMQTRCSRLGNGDHLLGPDVLSRELLFFKHGLNVFVSIVEQEVAGAL